MTIVIDKALISKVFKTFIEGAVGYFAASNITADTDLKVLLTGAIAAGLSLVINIDYKSIESKEDK